MSLVFENSPVSRDDLKDVDNMSRAYGSELMKLRLITSDFQKFFILE